MPTHEPETGLWEYLDEIIKRKATMKFAKLLARKRKQSKLNSKLDLQEQLKGIKLTARNYGARR